MNFSSIHIEGAELMNVGQATDKGKQALRRSFLRLSVMRVFVYFPLITEAICEYLAHSSKQLVIVYDDN